MGKDRSNGSEFHFLGIAAFAEGLETIEVLILDQMTGKTSMNPGWKAMSEDGADLPGFLYPAMKALETCRPVKSFIMGMFHPERKIPRWISVDAVSEFHEDNDKPFQAFTLIEDVTEQANARSRDGMKLHDNKSHADF